MYGFVEKFRVLFTEISLIIELAPLMLSTYLALVFESRSSSLVLNELLPAMFLDIPVFFYISNFEILPRDLECCYSSILGVSSLKALFIRFLLLPGNIPNPELVLFL
jgi:hypothetical protein